MAFVIQPSRNPVLQAAWAAYKAGQKKEAKAKPEAVEAPAPAAKKAPARKAAPVKKAAKKGGKK